MSFLEIVGLVIVGLVVAIILIATSRGWILLAIPAAVIVYVEYLLADLWRSPNFLPIVLWSVAVIAVIAALCWIERRWPTVGIMITVIIVIAALLTFGFFANTSTPRGDMR